MTRLLIIDSDPIQVMALKRDLSAYGFDVLTSSNGVEALRLAVSQQPDVIVSEIDLPEASGFEILQTLRADHLFQYVPFIFLTQDSAIQTLHMGMTLGADDFFVKPYPLDSLVRAVHVRLRRLNTIEKRYYAAVAELEARNAALKTLNHVAASISSSLQLDEVLREIARLSCETIGATSAYICDVDFDLGTSTVLAEYFSAVATKLERESDLGHTYILEQDFPTLGSWLHDPKGDFIGHHDSADLKPSEREEMAYYGLKSRLSVPLAAGDHPFGYIEIWETREKRYFTEDEFQIIHSIANQAAMSIAHAQLHQNLKVNVNQLETLNQELDAYSHMIAHDLKNPLTSIRIHSDLLRRKIGEENREHVRHLNIVDHSVVKMTEMIDQLLYRASLLDLSEEFEIVDMYQVAEEAVNRFESVLANGEIAISVAPDLPQVVGLAMELEEVFANLIGNGIKYMNRNHPTPAIMIRGYEQGNMVRYEVSDTGVGISANNLETLFDKFSRFQPTMATGFGLGLSIVHRIVTKLGGEVGVESVPMEGSTFWFALPVREGYFAVELDEAVA